MGKVIRGTNGKDTVIQSNFSANFALNISTFGGADQIKLDRTGDLGGDNRVSAGDGNDIVVNFFEGGNRIQLEGGNDTYVGTGFSSLGDFDIVNGGAGKDRFFVSTQKSAYLGGDGNDFFTSHGWENGFDGGRGVDTISYEFRHEDSVIGNQGVTIDLFAGKVTTGSLRSEQVLNIENAKGSLNNDLIGGGDRANVLMGLGGNDDIFGFGGKDILVGGGGSDFTTGGGAADQFVFLALSDSTAFNADHIKDFSSIDGDKINISAIDAMAGVRGNQIFAFIGLTAFSGHAGEARFSGGQLQLDVNGDRIADMTVVIENVASLQESDFIL